MQHLLMHLGMSGRIYIDLTTPPRLDKHEHLQIHFADGGVLRFIDPRRFGTVSFVPHNNWQSHPLISSLGPEPLTEDFSPQILWQKCQKSSIPIKIFIMQSHIVVGVGNIYASEALFYANINPAQAANSLNLQQCHKLYEAIIKVLEMAIQSGGSSLKDYTRTNGEQGYFQHQFQVYDRENDKCLVCHHATINKTVQSNRSSYYCPTCQPLMALPEWS
jgi:formamidopyrimidine-DNA glycosylase